MERWEADAAAWSFALAAGETRTSSFSVRRSPTVDRVAISPFLHFTKMVAECDDNVKTLPALPLSPKERDQPNRDPTFTPRYVFLSVLNPSESAPTAPSNVF
jgi:hypothetical protein